MSSSPPTLELAPATLQRVVEAPGYASGVCEVVARVASAANAADAVLLLRQAAERLGADSAYFLSFVRDDATLASYRFLLACDPAWGTDYARHGWCADDPWLHHALVSAEPCRGEGLGLSERQRTVAEAAARHGFRSTVIVPAPSPAAQSRVGLLCLGSPKSNYFNDAGFASLKVLARSLAMELHEWMQRHVRDELLRNARLTADDLQLLRFERQGLSSKAIGATLGIEAKTIDCRFQRINMKLGMANRRASVRLAELYELI